MKKMIRRAALACAAFIMATQAAFAGVISDAVNNAKDGVVEETTNALPAIIIVVLLAAGLLLLVMGRKGSETVKERAPWTIAGIFLVVSAASVAAWVLGLFS